MGKSSYICGSYRVYPDHPHGCGEKQVSDICNICPCGSSPRVWGKVPTTGHDIPGSRIIPTGVGKSDNSGGIGIIRPDHPHGCGEKGSSSKSRASHAGSSPRVWGKDTFNRAQGDFMRIIPTGVGKSKSLGVSLTHRSDHPHGCGEKIDECQQYIDKYGSSPRVWGKGLDCY